MIVKGRCRGNGAQLAAYLSDTRSNNRAECLTMGGTVSQDPRRALIEMSLSSELTGRTDAGLYHCQLSPREDEAARMTLDQKARAVTIMAEQMGLQGHKWALWEHEKDGRTHLHLVFERYDHETGRMWSDDLNYEKHQQAARQMEREFGWEHTHEKKNQLDRDRKARITELWEQSQDGREFVELMHHEGLEVTQGVDRRPFQVVDQGGAVHDLTRQLNGVRQREVTEYLNEIRPELRLSAEASQDRRQAPKPEPEVVQVSAPEPVQAADDWQESQTRMLAMKVHYQQRTDPAPAAKSGYSYSFKIQQSLTPPRPEPEPIPVQEPEPPQPTDPAPEVSQAQDNAAQLLHHYRQRKERFEQLEREARQQAADATQAAEPTDDLTDNANSLLNHYRQRRQTRGWENEGPEY